MADRKYYVFCDSNCKFESMTKEQILAAIAEATGNTVTDVDDAFITKIKEQNRNAALRFWFGTEAEYNFIIANDALDADTIYCIKNGEANVFKTPVRGVEYWTEADKAEIVSDVLERFINASEVAM